MSPAWIPSTQSAPAQRIPAWKRLGLKLKGPASANDTGSLVGAGSIPNPNTYQTGLPAKRKLPNSPGQTPHPSLKKPRSNGENWAGPPRDSSLTKRKSVSFAETPPKTPRARDHAVRPPTPKKQGRKKKKGSTKPPSPDRQLPVEYLRGWKTSRNTWKFNKRRQTQLLKYLFDLDYLPSTDIDSFYDYISDSKGNIKALLRKSAEEHRDMDTQQGEEGFPKDTEDAGKKLSEYRDTVADILRHGDGRTKRKHFDEVEFMATSQDIAIRRRVAKRMRAEILLDLTDSDATEGTSTTADTEASSQPAAEEAEGDKRLKLNDGTKRTVARSRKRRVVGLEEESSSESEEDSEDSTSSSSSSEESDDEDDEMDMNPGTAGYDTSSSSSSSSDGGSGSEEGSELDEDDEDDDVEG